MSFVVLLALLSVAAAVDELFFAEQLIKVYGNNDKLEVKGLEKLFAAVGTGGNAIKHTGNEMECGDSWINNTTCLEGMVRFCYMLYLILSRPTWAVPT